MPEPTKPDDSTFSIDDWLSGATRPEDVITLSSKGREYGEYKLLELELAKAQRAADDNPDDRLVSVGRSEPVRIATEMVAKAAVIDSGRQPFRLRAVSEAELKLMRETTKDLDEDEVTAHMLSLCCISPKLTPEKWVELRAALGEGQYTQAIRAGNQVTYGEAVTAPFSVAASVALSVSRSSET